MPSLNGMVASVPVSLVTMPLVADAVYARLVALPPEPLAAAVIRPLASTVRLVDVYEPGVTEVLASVAVMPAVPSQ